MPRLEFECDVCTNRFERQVPLREFDFAQRCPECGNVAHQIITAFPGVIGQFSASGRHDEKVYRTHNITHTVTTPDGSVTARPISPAQGCQCGNCASHLRRAAITAAAEPGKER